MVSEKVRRILVSMDAPFTDDEMEYMSDSEGWVWIYKTRPPKQVQELPEICFTGFKKSEKKKLQVLAENNGFKCVTKITKNLSLLCAGEDPGPTKIKEAKERGLPIVSEKEFLAKIQT